MYRIEYKDLISQTVHDVGFAERGLFIFTLETLEDSTFIEIINVTEKEKGKEKK